MGVAVFKLSELAALVLVSCLTNCGIIEDCSGILRSVIAGVDPLA